MRLPVTLTVMTVAGLMAGGARAEQRTYQVAPFDTVSVSTGISAIITAGGTQSVMAEAPNGAALDRLKVEVNDGRLEVGIDGNFVTWFFNLGQRKPIVVHIGTSGLKAAEANSGADLDLTAVSGGTLSLGASSGASISLQAPDAERVSMDVSSGASIKATGTCKHLIANVSSGGNIDARELRCDDVNAQASAGGHADVDAVKSINANASIGGGITVFGEPTDRNVNSGTGGSIDYSP